MFDLDKSIDQWKSSFLQSCSLSNENIDELESHLRDSIAELYSKGLSDEECFFVALKRIGQAPVLAAEFNKNCPLGVNQDRMIWMLSGYLGITLCGLLSTAIVSCLLTGMAYLGFGPTATGVFSTLVQILFWVGVFIIAARESKLTFIVGSYPTISLVVTFCTAVVLPFVSLLASAARVSVAEQTWQVETHYWTGLGGFAVQLLIFAFCLIALLKVRNSKQLSLEVS